MKIGVTYAVYITGDRLFDYAIESLKSIRSAKHELVFAGQLNAPISDEYRAALEEYGPLYDTGENCLARAWNMGINRLLREGCQYVFVPNLDIVVAPDAIDKLVTAARKERRAFLWTMSPWGERETIDQAYGQGVIPHPHFSAFMVNRKLFRVVGPFDEQFKAAYNEDLDMHWRIRLAGGEALQVLSAKFFHHGSVTIHHDPTLNQTNPATHGRNDDYFRRKWSYKPPTADDPFTDKMFRYPFDDPSKVGFEREVMNTWG
jgi:GT2 family glycosyltransferase